MIGHLSVLFYLSVGLKQGYVVSPWMFSLYVDGAIRSTVQGKTVNARVAFLRLIKTKAAGVFCKDMRKEYS